jgi:hypothetical protein
MNKTHEELMTSVRGYLDGRLNRAEFATALQKAAPNAARALPTKKQDIEELADTLVAIMKSVSQGLISKIDALADRVLGLEVELAQVRNKSMHFKGLFVSGDLYRQGETVRYADALYVARRPTMKAPTDDREAWELVSGRNGV